MKNKYIFVLIIAIYLISCNSSNNVENRDTQQIDSTLISGKKELSIYIINQLDSLDYKYLPSALSLDLIKSDKYNDLEVYDNYSCSFFQKNKYYSYFRVFWDNIGDTYLCVSFSQIDSTTKKISSSLYFLRKEENLWKDVSHIIVPTFAIDVIELQLNTDIKFKKIHKKEKLFAFNSNFDFYGFTVYFEKTKCFVSQININENDSISSTTFLELGLKDNVFEISKIIDKEAQNLLSEAELEKVKRYYTFEDAFLDSNSVYILDVSGNSIKTIPTQIKCLKKLQILNIDDNLVTNIPKEIGYLSNLQVLSLNNNDLSSISSEIGNLTNLEKISFTNNNLTKLPKEFENLKNLRKINIDGNKFTSLPVQLFSLHNIAVIDASNNSINTISQGISNLENLQNLNLSNNLLNSLPENLSDLYSLEELTITGNEINSKTIEKLKNEMPKVKINN